MENRLNDKQVGIFSQQYRYNPSIKIWREDAALSLITDSDVLKRKVEAVFCVSGSLCIHTDSGREIQVIRRAEKGEHLFSTDVYPISGEPPILSKFELPFDKHKINSLPEEK